MNKNDHPLRMWRNGYGKAMMALLAGLLALFASSAALALEGPVSPPPGGVTVTLSDPTGRQIGLSGGLNSVFTDFDFSQFDTLYWGAVQPGEIGFAFDGAIDTPDEAMDFNLAQSDLANGMARWTGKSTFTYWTGGSWATPVLSTQFTLRVTGPAGNPIPLELANAFELGEGAVITVTGNFTANLLVEAYYDSWQPALGLFNAYNTPPEQGGLVLSSFTHAFYYTDLPLAGLTSTNDSPMPFGSPTTLTATVASGTNAVYAWDFGDGTLGSGTVITHTYQDIGIYTTIVTASNSINALTATTTITIVEASISGLAATNDSPTLYGRLTTLTATVASGSNISFTWDLGDGTLGNGQVVAHTYAGAGLYTATVTATNVLNQLVATTTITIPFKIATTVPPENAAAAARTEPITVTFNDDVDSGTLSAATFQVRGTLSARYLGTFSTVAEDAIAFDPSADFKPGETLAILARSGIQSSRGAPLIPYTWQFQASVDGGNGSFVDSLQRLGSSNSTNVALGDLDGDGDLDAFVVNTDPQPSEVWLNNGAGTFADSGQSLGSASSWGVALGDVDGDGDLDALVANSGGQAKVWLNNGAGTFTDSGQNVGSVYSMSVALGDLDHDGDLDAFVGGRGTTYPYTAPDEVWLNDGSGIFTDSGQRLGNGLTRRVALGDVDGDGDLDVFAAHQTAGFSWLPSRVWLNDGAGNFADSGQTLSYNMDVALGDVDGDGDLDAVTVVGSSGTNQVLLNDGSGQFVLGPSWGDLGGFDVNLGDLDGDGDLDAFVATAAGSNSPNQAWLNDGAGTFINNGQKLGASMSLGAALGDLDGDGDLDAFVANTSAQPNEVWLNAPIVTSVAPLPNSHTVALTTHLTATLSGPVSATTVTTQTFAVHGRFHGQLSGTLSLSSTSQHHSIAFAPPVSFHPGELVQASVGRGILDPGGTSIVPYVWQFRTAASGGSGQFVDSGQSLGNSASFHVELGDLDADGDLDAYVAITEWPNKPPDKIWLNDGSGTFFDSGQSLGVVDNLDAALGDVNGDGYLDVFVAAGYDEPSEIWLNDGDGTFTDSGQRLGTSRSYGVALGDLDGDGDLDAFIANYDARPDTVWFNDGAGNFVNSGQNLGDVHSLGVELGDVDGDGDLDAYVASCLGTTPSDKLWINNGLGIFSDSGQSLDGLCSYNSALGDLDDDGDLDVVVANGAAGGLPNAVWLNNGVGIFTFGQNMGNTQSTDVALGDLDDDGDLDIFVANSSEPDEIWLNDGSAVFTDSDQSLSSFSARSVALGDLDGDDDMDAFIANSADPDEVWLNQAQAVDLSIVKTITPTSGAPGVAVTYTLTFSNGGNVATGGVVITDHVPVSVTVQGVVSSGVSLNQSNVGNVYTWEVSGTLAIGANGVITLVGQLTNTLPVGVFTNTATITATGDITPNNNSSDIGVTVLNVAPLADAGSDQDGDPGDSVTLDGSGSSDANGDALSYLWRQTGGVSVTLSDSAAESPTFTVPGAAGALTFTLTVTDSLGLADGTPDEVVVTINNVAPVAADDRYTITANTLLQVSAPGVLANDDDANGEALTAAVLVTDVTRGALELDSSGAFTYTSPSDYWGVVTFTYVVTNSSWYSSNIALVTITVQAADLGIVKTVDPASAIPGKAITYTLTFSNVGSATATGVVITDSIPVSVTDTSVISNGIAITHVDSTRYVWNVANLAPGAGGVITITGVLSEPLAAGTFTNTIIITTTAVDSDPGNNVSSARVTVQNVAPVANNDAYSTDEDATLTVSAPGVLGNDSDANGQVPTAAVLVTDVAHGELTLDSGGSFVYTPTANYNGPDSFNYHASNGFENSAVATVTLTINPVNDPPVASSDEFSVVEDTNDNVLDVLANDSVAPDTGETLTVSAVGAPDQGGTVSITGLYLTYTPTTDFVGIETFTYTVSDGQGGLDSALVAVTVTAASIVRDNYVSQQSGPWTSSDTWLNGGTPTASDNVTITSGTTVTVGSNAQCYRLFVEPGGVLVIPDGVTLSVEGELVNEGELRQVISSVPAGSPTHFLHIRNQAGSRDQHWGVVITPTGGSMGVVTVSVRGGQDCNAGGEAVVRRCYDLAPTTTTVASIVRFYYREAEANGNTAPNVYHWNGYGWQNLGAIAHGAAGAEWRWVQTAIVQYSPFALADDNHGPTPITLLNLRVAANGDRRWFGAIMGVMAVWAATWVRRRKRRR